MLFGTCTQLQAVSKKDPGHIHHHCVLDYICQRSSRSTFPLSDVELPGSPTWFKTFRVVTPGVRRHHDLLHQGILSILSVWRVSTVYQSTCLSSVGFLNRSDRSSDTALRYQGQCTKHLHAALQVCIAQHYHACQGDRISLDFASAHHLVRNRTDEAHVYSEAESKVLVLCIDSIERRRLTQASQVLEQLCIQTFGGHNRSQNPQRRRSKVVNGPAVSKDWLRYHECCQDDSVNCSCFRKDKMKLKATSIDVRARVRMSIVQVSCICGKLKKKKQNTGMTAARKRRCQ